MYISYISYFTILKLYISCFDKHKRSHGNCKIPYTNAKLGDTNTEDVTVIAIISFNPP